MTKLRKASLLSHKQQQHITNTSRSKNIGSDVHNKERSFRIIYVLFLICFPIMIFVGGNLNSQLANLKNYVPKSTYHDDGMSKIVPNETPYSELGQSVEPSIPTEKQKKAGRIQIQESHSSAFNRYPDKYSSVEEYFHEDRKKKKNLLSFGAANGMEAITLAAMYFNDTIYDDASVFGVDLHQPSLDQGKATAAMHDPHFREGKITFFNGKDTEISLHGPYDAIFANSVLCFHGSPGVNPKSIVEKYPFENFQASLDYLDGSLKVGDVLAIVNSNYHFSDTNISKKYRAISKCSNFVPKVNVHTISYEKIDLSALDCVWVKES